MTPQRTQPGDRAPPCRALVVDDGGADRQNMVNILTEAGCAVVSASNAVHAIALARERLPQIIFMDIVMPGMDGYQACRRLSEDPATRDIPVVFVSTKSHRADHLWARMQGGKALIAKPFTAEQLLAALQHANPPGH